MLLMTTVGLSTQDSSSFFVLQTLLFIFQRGRKEIAKLTQVKKNKQNTQGIEKKTLCSLSSGQCQPSLALNSLKIVNRLWHIDYLTAAELRKKTLSSSLHTFLGLRPQNNCKHAFFFYYSVCTTRVSRVLNENTSSAQQMMQDCEGEHSTKWFAWVNTEWPFLFFCN